MTGEQNEIRLGLGLIGIGREWGFRKSPVPDEKSVHEFLDYAYTLGITFFDTAASYGSSEERFGKFLRTLSAGERNGITVATKFGDHWDAGSQTAFVDHSRAALCASLDRSLKNLGKIDILQLHRPNPDVLRSDDVRAAFDYARGQGIKVMGASVSEVESGTIACNDDLFSIIQLPFNAGNKKLEPIIELAAARNKTILINRPYEMGAAVYADGKDSGTLRTEAFRLIVGKKFRGVVLTGTKSAHHLKENMESFNKAISLINTQD
jgi:aryl-alcohol dehydrogenase-like predicted oxidoreductase